MMTADLIRRTKWNESHKERVKIKAMDQLWPPQGPGLYHLVHYLMHFWQSSQPPTVFAADEWNWSNLLQSWSLYNHLDASSSVLSMKQVTPPSKDTHSQYLRLRKGYQHICRNTTGTAVLQRKLRNNSDILKALETKDFGKIFYQLVAQVLVCASQANKTGGKSGNTKHSFSGGHQSTFKSSVPFTGQSSEQKFQSDKDLASCVAKTVSFLTVNRAICGSKTISFPSDEQDNFSDLKSEDLQAILQLVITGELLKSHILAFQRLFYWAFSVQVLLCVLITIIDNFMKLQSEGDDKNNRSLEVNEKESEANNLKALPSWQSTTRFQLQCGVSVTLATFEGQMYANHNGFGQGDMMDDYDMGRFGNGGGAGDENGEFVEDFGEIPDFGNFGDNENDEMIDDAHNDEFERRFRAAYEVEGALRRVPSVSALPPIDDFLNGEDESDYSHAGMLGGWANETIVQHGVLDDIIRQIGEVDPIPLDPEPPHGLGQDLQVQLWLEEPLVFEQMLMEEIVANAA